MAIGLVACALCWGRPLGAQEPSPDEAGPAATAAETPPDAAPADAAPPAAASDNQLSLWSLIWSGGPLMIPIVFMLVLVIAITIERALGLRRMKVMPVELIDGLGQLAAAPGGFDPRKAYRLCQQFPSSASTVIRAMLLKVGRPHSEVEHTVAEASDREASRLYKNVGWLTLAAAVTPLLGLLGTVWGLVMAFEKMTHLPPGSNMAMELSEGIYTALVTTLGGLFVAIPAAILAHYFEGRIRDLFHEIDELLFSLMPQVERYEGRLRVSRQSLAGEEGADSVSAPSEGRVATAPK
ncbi:MAG: MotA/TolQ/ExbB proton channel family protein [Planctomycetales bacterium]|nr:MotA/TolQ/ExbB proton channel family protein [Planctomycetales bacterium]